MRSVVVAESGPPRTMYVGDAGSNTGSGRGAAAAECGDLCSEGTPGDTSGGAGDISGGAGDTSGGAGEHAGGAGEHAGAAGAAPV